MRCALLVLKSFFADLERLQLDLQEKYMPDSCLNAVFRTLKDVR